MKGIQIENINSRVFPFCTCTSSIYMYVNMIFTAGGGEEWLYVISFKFNSKIFHPLTCIDLIYVIKNFETINSFQNGINNNLLYLVKNVKITPQLTSRRVFVVIFVFWLRPIQLTNKTVANMVAKQFNAKQPQIWSHANYTAKPSSSTFYV